MRCGLAAAGLAALRRDGAQAYMRRALAEYLAPGATDEGVPGLSTA
ncbi:hypothetical protein [Streptomyces syringium]